MKDIPSIRPIPKIGGYDKYTLELTRLIREKMVKLTGKSPEMIAMLADRAFIDVNRNPGEAAYRHDFTKKLYEAHYAAIDAALARVKEKHGTGFMVLVHSGWNYPVQIAIGVNHVEKWCTIPTFAKEYGWDTFHGPDGIGGRLFSKGYEVPGFGSTPPGNDFAGVPILTRCRKEANIGIDGLEFEFQGSTLLANEKKREKLAHDVADVLLDFVNKYYTEIPFPGKGKRPVSVLEKPSDDQSWRTWTTADGQFTVEAKLVRSDQTTVTLTKRQGGTITVKTELLSTEDREFLNNARTK